MRWPKQPRLPRLPEKLRRELELVKASVDRDMSYYPCRARLKGGKVHDCVYVLQDPPYIEHWGVYPEEDDGKPYLPLDTIEALDESPSRIPASFANELYEAGESGMGYTIFTVIFADGSRQAYLTGNAVDFIDYPEGKGPNDVVEVRPHEGRGDPLRGAARHYWSLFIP